MKTITTNDDDSHFHVKELKNSTSLSQRTKKSKKKEIINLERIKKINEKVTTNYKDLPL